MRGESFEARISTDRDFLGVSTRQKENFTPLLVGDLYFAPPRPPWLRSILQRLGELTAHGDLVHFFEDRNLLPPDADCTAVAYSLALRARQVSRATAMSVAQRIAANHHPELGIVRVYFDPGGPRANRIDAVVCLNALYLMNQVDLAGVPEFRDVVVATERHAQSYFQSGQYEAGSRYYPCAATSFYFLARLLSRFPARYCTWLAEARRQIKSHQGRESHPLELAQRALAATRLGLDPSLDVWLLRKARLTNGAFQGGALYQHGRSAHFFGGPTISTAFAARALIESRSNGSWRRLRR